MGKSRLCLRRGSNSTSPRAKADLWEMDHWAKMQAAERNGTLTLEFEFLGLGDHLQLVHAGENVEEFGVRQLQFLNR